MDARDEEIRRLKVLLLRFALGPDLPARDLRKEAIEATGLMALAQNRVATLYGPEAAATWEACGHDMRADCRACSYEVATLLDQIDQLAADLSSGRAHPHWKSEGRLVLLPPGGPGSTEEL